jgi:hypothetical protein
MAARDNYAHAADEFFNALNERRTASEILAAHRRLLLCCQQMQTYAIINEMERQLLKQFFSPWAASDYH